MSKITKPGFYDLSNEAYHGDCCDAPSLSSSGAVTLIESCPARFWFDSYLNPQFEKEHSKAFDIGSAAHLLALEPHDFDARIVRIDADSYRTVASRDQRDEAYKLNKIPLLPQELETVRGMRAAIQRHPIAKEAFVGGQAEKTLAWKDAETGIWCKVRPDYMPLGADYLIDYKTAASAHPDQFERQAAGMGYYQRAAWYMDGVEALTGKRPKDFYLVVQEKEAPYLISVFKYDFTALEWGNIRNAKARAIFADCLKRNEWPGYRPIGSTKDTAFDLTLPSWTEKQLEQKHGLGAFDRFHRLTPTTNENGAAA